MNNITKDVRNLSYTYLDPISYLKLISENPGEFDPKVCKKILENEGKNNTNLDRKIADAIVYPQLIEHTAYEIGEDIARKFPKMSAEELKKFAIIYNKPSSNYLEVMGKMLIGNVNFFDNIIKEHPLKYGEYIIENHFNLLEDVATIIEVLRDQAFEMIEYDDGKEVLVQDQKLTKLITLLEDKIKLNHQ